MLIVINHGNDNIKVSAWLLVVTDLNAENQYSVARMMNPWQVAYAME